MGIGSLLGWFQFHLMRESDGVSNSQAFHLIASTVSSKMLRSIAQIEDLHFHETLTGFKWMANLADELEKKEGKVLMAYEESIGYMLGTKVLDKDGISGAVRMSELIFYCQSQGLTLLDKLKELYHRYGYHCNENSYFYNYDQKKTDAIFHRLRNFKNAPNTYPEGILNGKYRISKVRDLTTGYDSASPDGKSCLPADASSQMLTFTFENGFNVTFRTSGTEPKLKYYAEYCASPTQKNWKSVEEEHVEMLKASLEEFLEPTKNNLESLTLI